MDRVVSLTGQKTTDFLQNLKETGKASETEEGAKKKEKKKNIFAGDLNLMDDPVVAKRKEARKQAMKIVQDAWESDRSIDDSIQKRKEHYEQMKERYSQAGDEILEISGRIEEARQRHMAELDSGEQKDLELEQEEALTLYKRAAHFKSEMRDAKKQMKEEVANIAAIKIERLKTHGMADAQKNAAEIMENASKEIIGMLKEEAVENIDKAKEEAEKKAEETSEKKEKEEEKLDELKLKRAEQEALILKTKEAAEEAEKLREQQKAPRIDIEEFVDIAESFSKSDDVKQSLEEIKNSMKLLEADLKGIRVDEEV